MISHSPSRISEYSPAVRRSRNTFLRQLSTTPDIIRNDLMRHYKARVRRAHGKPLLGEYAPWLLADLLSIQRPTAVQSVSLSWMHLYAYTLIIDDIIDRPGTKEAGRLVVASGLLLQRGLSGLCDMLPKSGNIRVSLDKYFIESATAVMEELRLHRGRLNTFTNHHITEVGKKVALLKLCARCLLIADGRSSVTDAFEVPVDLLATGMQLLDDLSDWEEDWQGRAYSSLLTSAFEALCQQGVQRVPHSLSRAEVLVGLLATGSITRTLHQALNCLEKLQSNTDIQIKSAAGKFLARVIRENRQFLREATDLDKFLVKRRTICKPNADWLKTLSTDRVTQRRLLHFEKKLAIVCQSS